VAPQAQTTDFPLQSFELQVELDTPRHRLVPYPLCGRLDLQSFLDPPVVSYSVQHSLSTLTIRLRLEVFPTGPGRDPRQKNLLSSRDLSPHYKVYPTLAVSFPPRPEGPDGKQDRLS
jgi:hypothetical protein